MRDFIQASAILNDGAVEIGQIEDAVVRERCCRAFNELADLQRGEPERLGGGEMNNPNLFPNGTGLYTQLTEHVGDLTNRMAANWATGRSGEGSFGYEFVHEKVAKMAQRLAASYGFEREIREQVERNYHYCIRAGRAEDRGLAAWWSDLEEAGLRYAAAHAKLPVYNDAQWHARQAAISAGNMDYPALGKCLQRLSAHLVSVEQWIKYASRVNCDQDGWPKGL